METRIEDPGPTRGPTLTSSWDAACGALTRSLLPTRAALGAPDLDWEHLLAPPAPGQDLVSLQSSPSPRGENPCFLYLSCGPNGGEEILSVGVLSSARNMEVYLGEEYCGTSRGKSVCTVLEDRMEGWPVCFCLEKVLPKNVELMEKKLLDCIDQRIYGLQEHVDTDCVVSGLTAKSHSLPPGMLLGRCWNAAGTLRLQRKDF